MNRAIAWFAKNHVASNLLMWAMLIGGLLAWPTLRQEMFPDIDLEVVTVTAPYPGAAPAEVEDALVVRIEEAVSGLAGVKRIRSAAAEGVASVSIELHSGEDVARRMADIRARVDAIESWPEAAERPTVTQAEFPRHVLSIAVWGDADERALKTIAQRAREELAALPEISEVSLASVRPDELAIEVSEEALSRYGLSFDAIVAAVRRSSLDLPGGSIRAEGGEILLRAKGRASDAAGFAELPLLTAADGSRVRLGDVARVVDGFAETDQRATFDGKPAVLVQVMSVGDQKAIEVARAAAAWVDAQQGRLPAGVSITVWQDMSAYLQERLDSLFSNAWSGFAMVIVVLALFLRLRLAFWVALGVPTAFLGAVAVMPLLGITINWISLLGFLIVLGILVDDAIVVGENTYTEQRRSATKLEGAIRGAQGIAVPVVFGVLTTVAAFAPMLFIPGAMGRLVIGLPLVVIACLALSLFEAMFILPSHLAAGKPLDAPPRSAISKRWRRVQDGVVARFDAVVERVYRPMLERALAWRYAAFAIAVGVAIVTATLVGTGWLRFVFQEPVEGDLIIADLTMEPGTPAETTAAAVRALEEAAFRVRAETDATRDPSAGSIFSHVLASVGEQPFRDMQSQMPGGGSRRGPGAGAHLGEVQVEMIDPDHRDLSTAEMQRRWREAVPALPGVVELAFHNSMAQSGKPLEIELRGGDLAALAAAADDLEARLAAYPGVFDAADSFRGGKPELQFRLLPSGEALGLSLADVARQVRQAFHGEEAQRIPRGREDVRVVVRTPGEGRRSLADVERLHIRTADGRAVPFASVAEATLGQGFAAIQRVDRERTVVVSADVDVALASPNAIAAEVVERDLPALEAAHGVRAAFAGEQAEQRDFLSAMGRGQLLALIAIYALLAIPLRSYLQPFVIMLVIPFGAVGAALGHLIMGYDLTMYSVIGIVALSGMVVNASLVLVDDVNQRRASGDRLIDAVRGAGQGRLRAIFLTELTTFVGLLPMMFERAMFARFMIPLAISLAFGVVFASLITLLLVPCATLILEDVYLLASGTKRRRAAERIAAAAEDQREAEAGYGAPAWSEGATRES